MTTPTIPDYPIDTAIEMNEQGTWPASIHCFNKEAAAALRAAEATGRPLLVRGLPGVGKSQMARAAAVHAERPFLSVVIDGRTEPHDLMWRFDAVRRLGHAQIENQVQAERKYIVPQALWWAYNWNSALEQLKPDNCVIDDATRHVSPADWSPETGRAVLLIDEIDKADPDLPNALLEVLANQGFPVPYGGIQVHCKPETRPLIVITTNEERELPNAFLRRCLVLTLELPKDDALEKYLISLAERHQDFLVARKLRSGKCLLLDEAAKLFMSVREQAERDGHYLPGTSEYLDLVGALAKLWPNKKAEQKKQLELLGEFTLKKSPKSVG